jgi:ABC-2 type transport system ATP-binding protein
LPDVPFLYDHLTPNETITFLGGLYRIPPDEVARRAAQIWAELDISERANELIAGLSRGARKKVALAMSLLHRPRALLLDEPTAGLDPQTVRTLKDRIVAEARSGTAIIFSSHQLEVVEELATHLLVLKQGQAVMLLPMREALERARSQGLTLEGLFLSLTDGRAVRAAGV